MPFEKVEEPKKRSSYVAEQIIEAINNGDYHLGDRLPSERQIAEQMGVSRNSVREALSALQIVEVVETKAGSGTYIKSSASEINVNQALTIAKESEDLLEVWEARREVEMSLARLALLRADREELDQLHMILDNMSQAISENDYEQYLQTNESFHMAIADFASNAYLKNALEALLDVTKEHLLKSMVNNYSEYMNQSYEAHKKIFKVIAQGKESKVPKVINDHFRELGGYLKENLFRE